MAKYSIGVDYGSLSGRAVLVNVETGEEICSSVLEYPHAVMSETLPDGTPLGVDWGLAAPPGLSGCAGLHHPRRTQAVRRKPG